MLSAKRSAGTGEEGADRLGDYSHVAAVHDLVLGHEALRTVIEDDGNAGRGGVIACLFLTRPERIGVACATPVSAEPG